MIILGCMKKLLVLFALAVIVAAQISFIISFQSASTFYDVTGTSAVVISKMNYASVRASIIIYHITAYPAPVLIFPNGTRQELTTSLYSMDVFLPRTGDFLGDHDLETMYGDHLEYSSSYEGQLLVLSRDHPTDVRALNFVDG